MIKKNRRGKGYFVYSSDGSKKLNKKPKSYKNALKQLQAVEISKSKHSK